MSYQQMDSRWLKQGIKSVSYKLGLYPYVMKARRLVKKVFRIIRSPLVVFDKLNERKYRERFSEIADIY